MFSFAWLVIMSKIDTYLGYPSQVYALFELLLVTGAQCRIIQLCKDEQRGHINSHPRAQVCECAMDFIDRSFLYRMV
jgi:hypothetical protein